MVKCGGVMRDGRVVGNDATCAGCTCAGDFATEIQTDVTALWTVINSADLTASIEQQRRA